MTVDFRQSMAWLARQDGSVVLGHGPMTASDRPPPDAVAFYVRDFANDQTRPWQIPASYEILGIDEFIERFPPQTPIQCSWDPLDTVSFSEVFQEIMTPIREGLFEKTVPVVTESGNCPTISSAAVIAAMARCKAPLHSYGFVQGTSGFAGATPELLFTLDGSKLQTMALAGTARNEDRDIFAVDEKEIREHEYVAQTLVAKLLDVGTLQRETRKILDLGPIVHFLTRIRVDLREGMRPEELLKRLHPTPALGPLPRTDTTMSRLLEWRSRLNCPAGFGAPFGAWECGRFEAVVAIRGVWWQGQHVQIPAGCGIIEASRLVNEWRELRLKREAVKRSLGG